MTFASDEGCNDIAELATGRLAVLLHIHFTFFADTGSAAFAKTNYKNVSIWADS